MDEKRIVFLETITSAIRRSLLDNLPAGFSLTFADAQTEQESVDAVGDADFLLLWAAPMSGRVVEAAANARLIQKIGEGTDRIDVAAATRRGIPVAKTSGANSASVAELATMLMLAVLRRLPEAHRSTMEGRWEKWELRPGCRELRGKQVGIVGLGKIGKLVAEQVRGFRASVVYCDLLRKSEQEEAGLDVRFMPLDELLQTSDIVTLHLPLNASTRELVGRRELGLMKPTAILINTCRAAVVDEEALYEVLKEKRIRGAGIDVFAKEPPGPNHLFFSLGNVVVTPHFGGTEDSELRCIRHAYDNIVRVSQGLPLDPADLAPGL